jgi:transposase
VIEKIQKMSTKVVIPPKSSRKIQRNYDRTTYKARNIIEHLFGKLKHWPRIATHYDKTDLSFQAFLSLAGICTQIQ